MDGSMARSAEHLDETPPVRDEPELTPEQLAEIQAAWEREVLWIAEEMDAGRMKSIPWEEVRDELFREPK
jgi:hypothetical protein